MMHKIFTNKWVPSLIFGFLFFVAALLTINDYNIMWDGRNHFFRGQAFANFFLSGRRDYEDLPMSKESARYYRDYTSTFTPYIDIKKRLSLDPNYRRSIYQDETHTFNWLMQQQATGHPTLSDTISSFFNIAFYEKLGWLRDDHAYALYGVVLASILVSISFYWIYVVYGFLPALVSTVALVTTPLFWAESHYNIKDIPILVFFFLAIWSFYKGLVKYSVKWIITSSVLAGFALGTKFNALFIPPIIFLWSFINIFTQNKLNRKKYFKWWWIILVYPLIMFVVLVIFWPQLWANPIGGFLNVLAYYKEVGLNIDYTPAFRTIFNFSTYASIWILVTTYPVIVLMAMVGVIGYFISLKKNKDTLPLLFLIWFLVPIIRASLPNASIFGGVRHIIEYIPPLSFMSGYGSYFLVKLFPGKLRWIIGAAIVSSFIPFLITLIKLHPAENVYFNNFIGGLPGAKNANLTGWGNTDGGIYEKAVEWINKNAQKNSHLAVGFSELADFYLPEFREDLRADNQFSGSLQKGEYVIALTHNSELEQTYRMLYPETFLTPVYEYKVDGVPLIKIWKNEREYVKPELRSLKESIITLLPEKRNNVFFWDLKKEERLMAIDLQFLQDRECKSSDLGFFQISNDSEHWTVLPENYPGEYIQALGEQPKNNNLIALISGFKSRYIEFIAQPDDACPLRVANSKITILR